MIYHLDRDRFKLKRKPVINYAVRHKNAPRKVQILYLKAVFIDYLSIYSMSQVIAQTVFAENCILKI